MVLCLVGIVIVDLSVAVEVVVVLLLAGVQLPPLVRAGVELIDFVEAGIILCAPLIEYLRDATYKACNPRLRYILCYICRDLIIQGLGQLRVDLN